MRLGSSGIAAIAFVGACSRPEATPAPEASAPRIPRLPTVARDPSPAEEPPPPPPPRSWRVDATTRPGRVVVADLRPGAAGRLHLVDVRGRARALAADGFLAFPYAAGQMLAITGSHEMEFRPVGGAEGVRGEYDYDDIPWSVSDEADAGLYGGYDTDEGHPTIGLWNLWNGEGAGAPQRGLDRCPLGQQGDVAPDGTRAVFACVPCGCTGPDGKGDCEVALCELTILGHRAREVSTRPGGHFSPVFTGDGRLVFGSARFRDDTTCGVDGAGCTTDVVAVPADALDGEGRRIVEAAKPLAVSRVSGRLLVATTDETYAVVDASGGEPVALAHRGSASAPRAAFSADDGWVALTAWGEPPRDGERPSPTAVACPVDGKPCVELGAGVATGWVRDEREVTPTEPGAVTGCWTVDLDTVWHTNERPHGMGREAFDQLVGGIGLRIEPDAVTLWLDHADKLHFAERFPTKVDVHPGRILLDVSEPEGYDEEAARAHANAAGLLPPMRIDQRLGKIVLRRLGRDGLASSDNFLASALWGHSTGPLRLSRATCPDPIPSRPGG